LKSRRKSVGWTNHGKKVTEGKSESGEKKKLEKKKSVNRKTVGDFV